MQLGGWRGPGGRAPRLPAISHLEICEGRQLAAGGCRRRVCPLIIANLSLNRCGIRLWRERRALALPRAAAAAAWAPADRHTALPGADEGEQPLMPAAPRAGRPPAPTAPRSG